MTYNSTIAAGDFLTNDSFVCEAFPCAPANWHRKNVQVVLRTMTVGGTASPFEDDVRQEAPPVLVSRPLDQVAEGYRAMDERRAIKTLLRP